MNAPATALRRRPRPGLRLLAATAGIIVLGLAGTASHADDTELYVGLAAGNPAAERPNILFILDNSGSMSASVATQADWDPAQAYDGCFQSDSLYLVVGGSPPICGRGIRVTKAGNRCQAAQAPLLHRGQYSGSILGWNADARIWEPITTGSPISYLECEADRGIHGGGGSGNYAANGEDGPWASTTTTEPGWNAQVTIFDGNWLNWRANPPTVTRSRLQIIQGVVKEVLDGLQDANVGLMQFNFSEGGAIIHAVADIGTARQGMKDAVDAMIASTRTPLSETLYEAALYFRGAGVHFGDLGSPPSVPAARIGGTQGSSQYLSPISAECQKNFIILLTDGEPTADDDKTPSLVAGLPGFNGMLGSCDGSGAGRCLDDLAEYLYRADAGTQVDGLQNVVTYTIGFEVDAPLLESTARRGGGRYYVADDTGSLANALNAVIAGITERSGTFTAPAVPVNGFNRQATERDAYVAVFEPTGRAHWPGNLKKYQFADGILKDRGGLPAIDPASGFFAAGTWSFWSASADGDRISTGGAASRLPAPGSRRLYTDLGGPQLSAPGNRIEEANPAISAALLGVPEAERDALIGWIRGADLADVNGNGNRSERRLQMGDPLHSRPVVVQYDNQAAAGTLVFITTNDGFLHAVDARSGVEHWAFLPSRLLPLQQALYLDEPTTVHQYGLDGEMRLYLRNNDGQPGIGGSEQAILLFGMGRGGTAVYALDVTAPDAPVLLWQVDRQTPGLGALGQTWAAPEVARIRIGDTVHEAVILSGGYDDGQDNRGWHEDSTGNALYFLDLLSGQKLWSAGPPGGGHDLALPAMRHSIPATPRVIDLSRDGLADRIYVGDVGGRVWRFDIQNGQPRSSLVAGGVLASLGGAAVANPPASELRRFYATPDLVLVDCIRGNFLAINIGSGYRGHPLDTDVADQFFSIRDPQPYGSMATASYGEPIRIGDLLDITDDPTATVPADAAGWRLRLEQEPGEKVLTAAATYRNTLYFTSFAPGAAVNACVGGLGVNRAYAVDACSGRPLTNLDGGLVGDPPGVEDRFQVLPQAGIAPEAVFLFPASGFAPPTRCIGLACFPPPADATAGPSRSFWTRERAR